MTGQEVSSIEFFENNLIKLAHVIKFGFIIVGILAIICFIAFLYDSGIKPASKKQVMKDLLKEAEGIVRCLDRGNDVSKSKYDLFFEMFRQSKQYVKKSIFIIDEVKEKDIEKMSLHDVCIYISYIYDLKKKGDRCGEECLTNHFVLQLLKQYCIKMEEYMEGIK